MAVVVVSEPDIQVVTVSDEDIVVINEPTITVVEVGIAGPQGPTGVGGQFVREDAIGAINGTNLVFTTTYAYQADTVMVYLNGLLLETPEGYSETPPQSVTLVEAPLTGDSVRVSYVR